MLQILSEDLTSQIFTLRERLFNCFCSVSIIDSYKGGEQTMKKHIYPQTPFRLVHYQSSWTGTIYSKLSSNLIIYISFSHIYIYMRQVHGYKNFFFKSQIKIKQIIKHFCLYLQNNADGLAYF